MQCDLSVPDGFAGAEARARGDCQRGGCSAPHCEPLAPSLCRPRARWAEDKLDWQEAVYTPATDKRILEFLDKPPPAGFARWTGLLLAKALGDVDVQYVWRCLRHYKIDLVARKSWCESNDPDFAAKAADVVGLYVNPPARAIVLCVDEKPSIQALDGQGY